MVILVTPALEGLLPQWREAAENLGASAWAYWRHVALPVLAPAVGGATLVLFGNAFAAYATALALTSGSIPLVPTAIAIGAVGQRARRTAERRAGAGTVDGRRHRRRDGGLPAAAAARRPVGGA